MVLDTAQKDERGASAGSFVDLGCMPRSPHGSKSRFDRGQVPPGFLRQGERIVVKKAPGKTRVSMRGSGATTRKRRAGASDCAYAAAKAGAHFVFRGRWP